MRYGCDNAARNQTTRELGIQRRLSAWQGLQFTHQRKRHAAGVVEESDSDDAGQLGNLDPRPMPVYRCQPPLSLDGRTFKGKGGRIVDDTRMVAYRASILRGLPLRNATTFCPNI